MKRLRKKTIFENYADQIWDHSLFAEDEKRWHSSGYHIDKGQLSIDDTIEDACEVLGSITPDEVKIEMTLEEWNQDYVDNPNMIAAMAKEIYSQLKEYGRYAFKEEPDWNIKAKEYIDDIFGDS